MKISIKNKLGQWKKTLKEMGKIDRKALKNGSFSMLYTVILVAAIVVINLIVGEIPEKYTQIDVSSQKLYTISDETVKFLKELQQDVSLMIRNYIEVVRRDIVEDQQLIDICNKIYNKHKC